MLLTTLLTSLIALAAAAGDEPVDRGGLPVKKPDAVGMSTTRLEKIDHVIARGIRAGAFPGAAVIVGRRGATVWEKGLGHLGWGSGGSGSQAKVDPVSTIYDLASLTKVIATTTAMMVLYDEGKVSL